VKVITATVEQPEPARAAGPQRRKVAEMRRVILSLVGALLAVTAATTSASAAPPIDVDAQPGDQGAVVTVYANVDGTQVPIESIKTGQLAVGQDPTNPDNGPGLCATGVIHNSCTPASEAAPNK
jgi:hypothetical protein